MPYGWDIWTIVILVFMAPFVIGTILYVGFMIFKVIHNVYIHIKYGLEYTDQDE